MNKTYEIGTRKINNLKKVTKDFKAYKKSIKKKIRKHKKKVNYKDYKKSFHKPIILDGSVWKNKTEVAPTSYNINYHTIKKKIEKISFPKYKGRDWNIYKVKGVKYVTTPRDAYKKT